MRRYGWNGETRDPAQWGLAYVEADVVPGDRILANGSSHICIVLEPTVTTGGCGPNPNTYVYAMNPANGNYINGYTPSSIVKA